MKKRIEIKSISGDVLFGLDKRNNTIKDTLEEAVKRGIELSRADLYSVDLCNADLEGALLQGAYLRNSFLSYANLRGASLINADLSNASLYGASLQWAKLRYACLNEANLSVANLDNADLCEAMLSDANLINIHFGNAKNIPFIPMNLPEGEFIAWKKLLSGLIAKLKILEDSKRSRATGDKCRCDKCLVLEFQEGDGTKSKETEFESNMYAKCVYKVGEIVKADSWDENRWNECSHGIHFFIDRQSAVDY